MQKVTDRIYETGIVPVVSILDAGDAEPLAQALIKGGLPGAEVTFRTDAAEEAIGIMTEKFPQMLVGAGTVLTVDQIERAAAAGAKFVVSRGFDPEIVDYCLRIRMPVFPGCVTPSEVAQAVKRGLKVVKFFPAQAFGGIKTIQAIAAPYGGLKFLPTGGIGPDNLKSYLLCKEVIACGGSWMVKSEMIQSGSFDRIEALTREAVRLAAKCRSVTG